MLLPTTLLTSLCVLVSSVTAQDATSSASSATASGSSNGTTFDINQVPLSLRNQWCLAERTACPKLCGGPNFIADNGNNCQGSDLTYTCTCSNGKPPANIDQYLDTLPNNICQATFAQCRTANPGSQACVACGTKDVNTVPTSATTSAGPSSTGSASGTASAAATSKGSAAGGQMGRMDLGVVATWAVLAVGVGAGALIL